MTEKELIEKEAYDRGFRDGQQTMYEYMKKKKPKKEQKK